jgi:hypothetical protein
MFKHLLVNSVRNYVIRHRTSLQTLVDGNWMFCLWLHKATGFQITEVN